LDKANKTTRPALKLAYEKLEKEFKEAGEKYKKLQRGTNPESWGGKLAFFSG